MISRILKTFSPSLILLCFLLPASAQNGQIKNHYDKLKQIQKEITSMEKEIVANQKKENSILYVLHHLDLDIDLAQSLVQKLRKDQRRQEKQIQDIEQNLALLEEDLARLKESMGRRLVHFYKHGRLKDMELLLTTRSLNQGLLWLEYQKRLTAHDKRNYQKILNKQASIKESRARLEDELEQKKRLLSEKLEEEKKLKNKKNDRQTLLASLRKDTALFKQQLDEKRHAEGEITRLISSLESNKNDRPMVAPDTPFGEMQGRLAWPAEGKVVAKFGKYKHPELKTVTENIGIDIEAKLGSPVVAVAPGRVTVITWQRGMGNIIIVRHYGGYYTVYTHLEEIRVNEQQEVQMGQMIGSVGESGSIKGPLLHFEIWQGTEKLDPEKWLAVRS